MDVQVMAPKLRQYEPKGVYSSDFMRDMDTAQLIARSLNLPIMGHDFNVRTWDLGKFNGQKESDVAEAVKYYYDRPWEIPPGSEESFNTFARRFQEFLDGALSLSAEVDSMRPMVIVTHGRNIALVDSYINSKNPWDSDMPMPAGYGLIRVNQDRSLGFEIVGEKEPVALDA